MHSPRIELAHASALETCPAIENGQSCHDNPRWIEEDWSAAVVGNLKRAQNDLGRHFDSFSREERVLRSKALLHGQVCIGHEVHALRLHTLQMIRGDARSDLRGPRYPKRDPAAGRRPRAKPITTFPRNARGQSIERGRSASAAVTQQSNFHDGDDDEPMPFPSSKHPPPCIKVVCTNKL